ncbi:MAG: oligosaccharide flippase family protein [Anaerolineae bacterium]|nr:oligosaccharide flippase family protein [Anaerolineae bacterium]
MSKDLARRSTVAVAWNMASGMSGLVVLFARSIILARLLPVETFGVYAGASALVVLTSVFATFGMGGAFLHRAAETEDENRAASIHFTLKLMFTAAWAVVLIAFALLRTTGDQQTALIVITLATAGLEITQTPRLILVRRVVHRRLALLQFADALLSTALAVGLALMGVTLWALLATDLSLMFVSIVGLFIWRPVWRPWFSWNREVVRYYLSFGSRNFGAGALLLALDRVDDLWTLRYLGDTALGYYSRAYTFATYPRRILAGPVNQVAGGTYAELKGERKRLSQAFFRTNALLVRSGFFLAGLLALIAPELIAILLGDKWLPMLQAFRLMLVYTLLDPIKMTVADLFVAVGRPELVFRVRLLQLGVMVVGLFALGTRFNIAGVALAVDTMVVVGITVLLWQAREYVDFSARRLFAVPMLALVLGLAAGAGVVALLTTPAPWLSATLKTVLFVLAYGGVLALLERQTLTAMVLPAVRQLLRRRRPPVEKA